MNMRRAIEDAVARLEPGGRVLEVCELRGGTSTDVYRVDVESRADEVKRVVFRQHRSDGFKGHDHRSATTEYGVLAALRRHGFEVPEPLLLEDGATPTAAFFILEWVDGTTDVPDEQVASALEQMADFLARLHQLDPRQVDVPGLSELEDPLAELAPYLPSTGIGARLRSALTAGEVERVPNDPVLLHGDYWPGNVMWDDGRLAAVIDWEDAQVGDPLADLACARVELLCRYGADAMERFTAHYLVRSPHRRLDALPLWEAYVAAAALATMASWGLDPAEEARRRRATAAFFDRAATELLAGRRR